MTTLLELKAPKERFARSINVERDVDSSALDGYLPVGRAIEVITRIVTTLSNPNSENAFSVTGPYGSGKSSLAVVLDALFAAQNDGNRKTANELINSAAPETMKLLVETRKMYKAEKQGFVRAVVTARREPISLTVLRALAQGIERFHSTERNKKKFAALAVEVESLIKRHEKKDVQKPDTRELKKIVEDIAELAPVLLIIDEFGKNLEAFADSHSDADLYLLQELAESTRGEGNTRLVIVTMQHLAFDEYAAGANVNQRREWAKIQGRFEDIPFVDTALQTKKLIAAAFEKSDKRINTHIDKWVSAEKNKLQKIGLSKIAEDEKLLADCWPLDPLAVEMLPELCERYGQNERTLFSFLASPDPGGVASFLKERTFSKEKLLPSIGLDKLYDYFLESAATLLGVSNSASRWLEIDTRIRDAHGLEEPQLKVLKTIGLLNLVSAGGTIRASSQIVETICVDSEKGTKNTKQIQTIISDLEKSGLITYRSYADEYRLWQGTDFDLKSSIEIARRRCQDENPAEILETVMPLRPVVAARHFHEKGTLRTFARKWVTDDVETIHPLTLGDFEDGIIYYVLGSKIPNNKVEKVKNPKPVVFITNSDPTDLIASALEVRTLDELLADTESLRDDWVANREIIERRAAALSDLEIKVEEFYGSNSKTKGPWVYLNRTQKSELKTSEKAVVSQVVSEVADVWYKNAPVIKNDLINRHEISAQIAKARKMLLEAMLTKSGEQDLGLEGNGPDKTLYRATIEEFGIHRQVDGEWGFHPPTKKDLQKTWELFEKQLTEASKNKIRIDHIYDELSLPPFGIRAGIAPIFMLASLLLKRGELALYEHGTFRPRISVTVVERLLKNPQNFEIKYFASRSGNRLNYMKKLAKSLQMPKNVDLNVVSVVSHLVEGISAVPPHTLRTKQLSEKATQLRKSLLEATEPDELIFQSIPKVLGYNKVNVTGEYPEAALKKLTKEISESFEELSNAYSKLLGDLRSDLANALETNATNELRQELHVRANALSGKIINQELQKLVSALTSGHEDDDDWIEYVAMILAAGKVPKEWTDEDRNHYTFELLNLSETFLRLESLNADLRTKNGSFDAIRVSITGTDGRDRSRVVAVDHDKKDLIEQIMEESVNRIKEEGFNDTAARDTLIALLAESLTGNGKIQPNIMNVKDASVESQEKEASNE